MVLGKRNIHMQKNELGLLLHMYKKLTQRHQRPNCESSNVHTLGKAWVQMLA